MADGVAYDEALAHYRAGASAPWSLPEGQAEPAELLRRFHPDYQDGAHTTLAVGPNRGERCQAQVAALLQSNSLIDEIDLAGAPVREADVLIVGGGGAGCAAGLAAAEQGARVTRLTKLQLGDSNTVMAEGGLQAAVGEDDTPQLHYEDTLRAGQYAAKRELVAQMVIDGPAIVRWLIQRGHLLSPLSSLPGR